MDVNIRKLNIGLSFVIPQNGAKDICSSKSTVMIRNKVALRGNACKKVLGNSRCLSVTYTSLIPKKMDLSLCGLAIDWKLALFVLCTSFLYTFIKMTLGFIFFLLSLFANALLSLPQL